jgi:serine/threonine protein kinase
LTLGRGNFGSVFCGQDKTSGAKVAIKRVPNDKDLRIYFEREIKLMKTVRDGNVVQLLEVIEDVRDFKQHSFT